MIELEKTYEARLHEDQIYQKWEKSGLFTPKIEKNIKPFVVPMPPPNATGTLHLGHAVMLAIQDIMIRYHRLKGIPSLWIPGTDHAGIATQNRVEKIIAAEGLTRHTLGREAFLKRVAEFVEDSKNEIRNQVKKMGASCDWTRERYTLDEGLSHAVRTIFTRMFHDGLIYRGNRIVNWCTRCASTLADDEVEFKTEKSTFYYLKYGPIEIGTARPETKFLDKVIAVHPDDKRYKKYHGKKLTIPWIDGDVEATIITDERVDPEFGTGAMTLTPAHDFLDFELAQKHQLEIVQIIDQEGNFTSAVGEKFAGKNARKSRPEIVKVLEEKDLLLKIDENYTHNLSVCYRCGTPIEPLISKQWFVDVNKPVVKYQGKEQSLKDIMAKVVKEKAIEIIPARFEKTYYHWINNLRDWCISRQLWWGHRIPVWYCENSEKNPKCSAPLVSTEAPISCPHCQSTHLHQDPDTLDTWFSSGLWTFSTLGWPEKTADLEYFHPTSVLETGYDILFFWIARMILMTTYAVGEIPFQKVYLHGLVRDKHGKKMSKSAGNGIDPLDMIEKYGTDAVRLSLVIGTSAGNDTRLYEEKIAGYRNFVNKIWNSARFAFLNLGDHEVATDLKPEEIKTIPDRWIISNLQKLIKETTENLENFHFSEAGLNIYDYIWDKYCDWYLEIYKSGQLSPKVISHVLRTCLILLHPFVPFVSETLWEKLHQEKNTTMLCGESWPKYNEKLIFTSDEEKMDRVFNVIKNIRSTRSEKNISPAQKINATIYAHQHLELIKEYEPVIKRMARLEEVDLQEEGGKVKNALWIFGNGIDIYLPVNGLFDIDAEKRKLTKQFGNLDQKMKALSGKLANQGFIKNAPAEIIEQEKKLLEDISQELHNIKKKLEELDQIS